MNIFELQKHKLNYFASCPLFLEDLLLEEVKAIDVRAAKTIRGGVEFEA